MKKVFHLVISSFILMLFSTSYLTAGNGKIAGVVKDSTGKPLKGASVILLGQKQIYLSDADGRYFILNLSPGKYDVVISATGFNKRTVKSVEVRSDLTTELNIVLESATVEAEGIIVDAERNLLNKTMTYSKTIYSADEIASTFSTSSTFEILQTVPSMYKGFLRGGLQNMTKTIVDGVDISDSYYEITAEKTLYFLDFFHYYVVGNRESIQAVTMPVNPNTISEISVNTGALGADYFSASAGIINYDLKEGKGEIKGKVYARTGAQRLGIVGPDIYNDKDLYFAERDDLFSHRTTSDSLRAKSYTWTENKYENGQVPFEGGLSLSGSINENLGFLFSLNYKRNPDSRLPNQRYKELNSQLKLTFNPNANMKITALGMLCDKGKLFGWKNTNYQDSWRYYLQGVPQNDGLSWVGSIKLSHFLSANSFYEVQVSKKKSNTRIGFVDGNNDGQLQLNEEGDFITFSDNITLARYVSGDYNKAFEWPFSSNIIRSGQTIFSAGRSNVNLFKPDIFYENFTNNVFTAKLDYTNQILSKNQINAGVSYVIHNLDMDRKTPNFGFNSFFAESWNVKPLEFGAYIQDKMEYANFVINLGLRFDLWDPKAANYLYYDSLFSLSEENTSYGNIPVYKPIRGGNVDSYADFSPRVAVSYQINDQASIYGSFSKTVQPQPLSMIYTNYNKIFGTDIYEYNIPTIDREPYKTTNYEIGAQWRIIDKIALNINAYYINYKNNFNSTSYQFIKHTYRYSYYLYSSTGYTKSKGIESTIEALQTEITDFLKISGRFSYIYSSIKAPNNLVSSLLSDPNGESELIGGGSTLNAGYNREHRIVYILNMFLPYDILLTSIGYFNSGFWYVKQSSGTTSANNELDQGPWNKQIDLRIEKVVTISKFRFAVFAEIKNLFNAKNILAYDNTAADYSVWQTNYNPLGLYNRPISSDGSLYYDIPREVYFGASFEF